ncbi:transcription initiation factor TFIID subunit 11-like [Zophobas morio]|uniref:transcription initiation factor TFIID subunit 11-like n=1 Tax=Zophobas morio TaxID=2755281 RepID=UPI0030839668
MSAKKEENEAEEETEEETLYNDITQDDDDEQPIFDVKKTRRFRAKQNAQKLALLLDSFTEEQNLRYEAFRCSTFRKSAMRKVLLEFTNSVSNETVIIFSGISKLYCGEIIERARVVQEQWMEEGPLQPKHIREAVRRLKHTGLSILAGSSSKKIF